jgi:hypothetical protein
LVGSIAQTAQGEDEESWMVLKSLLGLLTPTYGDKKLPLMSMLPLYTRISLISMIFDIHATFGSIIRL